MPALIRCTSPGRITEPVPIESLCVERALEHVGDDLHVAVRVGAEALAGRDAVVVDHAQRAEAHVLGVVVVGEREGVVGVEPAVVGVARASAGRMVIIAVLSSLFATAAKLSLADHLFESAIRLTSIIY